MILFSFNYPPQEGGIARLCAELATGLQRRGLPAVVLTRQHTRASDSTVPDLPEKRVTSRRPLMELQAWRYLRLLRDRTVICGRWYPEGLIAQLAGCKHVVVLGHGSELLPSRARWRRGIWRWLMRQVMPRAMVVITNSTYTASVIRSVTPEAAIVGIPPGVDLELFSPGDKAAARQRWTIPKDKIVLVTVARLVPGKGHQMVLDALNSAPGGQASLAEGQIILWLVAGDGPEQDEFKHHHLWTSETVLWLGQIQGQELLDAYRAADLFVLCPEIEGFGLAFLEAQACGVPVVGTRVGGIPDAVRHGDGGRLIEPGDVAALQRILSSLVADPFPFAEMGKMARARAERECSWDHYITKFIAILEETYARADAGSDRDLHRQERRAHDQPHDREHPPAGVA